MRFGWARYGTGHEGGEETSGTERARRGNGGDTTRREAVRSDIPRARGTPAYRDSDAFRLPGVARSGGARDSLPASTRASGPVLFPVQGERHQSPQKGLGAFALSLRCTIPGFVPLVRARGCRGQASRSEGQGLGLPVVRRGREEDPLCK